MRKGASHGILHFRRGKNDRKIVCVCIGNRFCNEFCSHPHSGGAFSGEKTSEVSFLRALERGGHRFFVRRAASFASAAAISAGGSVPNGAGEIDALFSHGVSLLSILSVVWAIGIVIFFLYSIFAASRLHKRVRFAVKVEDQSADIIGGGGHPDEPESFVWFSRNDSPDQAEKQPSSRGHRYKIYECAQVDSPFVAGIFRPKIYLPTGLTEYNRSLILAHEVCHIKRKNPLALFAAQTLAVIFWFHPLFWAAYRMMRRDMEMSCDERAVKGLERTQVADYSAVLLSFGIKRSHPLAMTFGSGQSALKKRISNLLSEKQQRPLLSAVAAAVSLCGAAILITAGCAVVHSDVSFTEWFQPITLREMEDSEAEVILKDMGTVIGQRQTVDGVTVTLDAAVRDEKNIILSFSVETEEELQIHGGMGESEESWMHGEWNLEEWKEQGGSDMTEEEFQQMYQSAEEELKHLNKLQFLCAASENTGYRILLAGRIPSENTKLRVHLEDVNFSDVSLKGSFDFTFTAERRAQSTVYAGDIPLKTESGEGYRVKRVSISPLMTGEIEIVTDRDLFAEESMEAPWNDEFVFDGIRIEGGLEFESVRTERTIDGTNVTLRRDRNFSEKASVARNNVILRRSVDQVFIDPTKVEAVNIGGVWLDLDRMVMDDNGTAGSEKKSDQTANSNSSQ